MSAEIETQAACAATKRLLSTSDLNWLLHRVARRLGDAMDAEAMRHGVGIRSHLVLTAVLEEPGRTQLALGAALGLDKTTLTTTLDKLEHLGLLVRRPDPADRRVRVPEVTPAGCELQRRVADAVRAVEDKLISVLSETEQNMFRGVLHRLATVDIGDAGYSGSCI